MREILGYWPNTGKLLQVVKVEGQIVECPVNKRGLKLLVTLLAR